MATTNITNERCAFYDSKKCKILDRSNCVGCSFFKTPLEFKKGRAKALEHFMSLPYEVRNKAISKYGDVFKVNCNKIDEDTD